MAIFDNYRERAKKRKVQIRAIEGVFDYSTLLYVGASPDRFEMVDLFFDAGYEIDVLEIHPPNVIRLKEINAKWGIFNRVIQGDVRHVEQYLVCQYDVILFWHGLEHIKATEHLQVIAKLEDWTKHLLIFGQPWGSYAQGPVKRNRHERHVSSLKPDLFKGLGYRTSIVGRKPGRKSNLVAWKRIGEA